ncbi:MAG: aldo/keto reductase [Solirubrobacteraceae bacterium]
MSPSPMPRGRLGSSGLEVPRVALGCGNFGGIGTEPSLVGKGLSDAQAFGLMDTAWELGITHFDTADAYAGGRSEAIVGRWIASRGVCPSLTTKTFFAMESDDAEGLGPARVQRQLASSLRRLGVEQVDLYLAHWFDPDVPLAMTLDAFECARESGLVRAYGVSNFNATQLRTALAASAQPCALENGYSLLQRDDAEELLALCARGSVAYLAHSPLCGGWLSGKYRRGEPFPAGSRAAHWPGMYSHLATGETFAALDRFAAYARGHNRSMSGLALAWVLNDPRVTQVIVGASQPAHFTALAEALANPLHSDERDRLTALCETDAV